jgi:F-type H+-transporting ATPase subunit epsilon
MSDKLLEVEIVSPQQQLFKGKAISVTVPGSLSPFQILYNHAPIFSTTEIGIVKIEDENKENHFYAVSTGFVEVSNNLVSIVVEQGCAEEEVVEGDIQACLLKYNKEIETIDEADALRKATILNKIKFEQTKLNLLTKSK